MAEGTGKRGAKPGPRRLHRLNTIAVAKSGPGRWHDGGGLVLRVSVREGSRRASWAFLYADRGGERRKGGGRKTHEIGLGSVNDVPLTRARDRAAALRASLAAGNDPLDQLRTHASAEAKRRARMLTFGKACEQYIAVREIEFRNLKHRAQWRSTLQTYCKPIWSLPVADVDTALVLKCLQRHWATKTETMSRVRQRMEKVLDWTIVSEFRSGPNPARWDGHLGAGMLAKPSEIKVVKPRSALPYVEAHAFLTKLRTQGGLAARAVELQLLTATRPGEAAGARWDEINEKAGTWKLPKARTKQKREHHVALSDAALALVGSLARNPDATYLFPGKPKKPITTAAMLKAARAAHPGVDTHGNRSTFRTWCAERTSIPREIAELALGHAIKGVEAIYQRSDLLAKRKNLANDWARWCESPPPKENADDVITPIGRKAKRA